MSFIREIRVEGLFGLYDHTIELRSEVPVTIVAGPNGIGKTTLLSMTRAVLQGTYRDVVRHAFVRLAITSDAGDVLIATPVPAPTATEDEGEDGAVDPRLGLEMWRGGVAIEESVLVVPSHPPDLALPPYVEAHGRDTYFDSRMGEVISVEEAVSRYAHTRPGRRPPQFSPEPPEWYSPADWKVDFIETKRLDTLISRAVSRRRRSTGPAPIDVYLGNVRDALEVARRESTAIRQRLDRTFVRRLLNRAQDTVNEARLRDRYAGVEALAEELRSNGLLSDLHQ